MKSLPPSDETLDSFFNGTLQVLQKKKGYRFSVDAVLLSQFIRIRKKERSIDLGTGCGIIPLLLSRTSKGHHFVGVEIQKDLADIAKRNVLLNCLESRISILHEDFRELRQAFPSGSFDLVFSNPPYRRCLTGRMNPCSEKAIARHELRATLDEMVAMASYLLLPKGRFSLIYTASRTVDLLVTLRKMNLEPKRIQFVHPRPGNGARFVLVESIKDSGVELDVMRPLILQLSPLRDAKGG